MTSLTDTQVVTASGGLVELGYGQITSSVTITSTSFTTPTTIIPDVTVVCDGSPILVEFYAPQTSISAGQSQIVFALWEDGAEKHRYWLLKVNPTGSTGVDYDGVKAEVRLTPSAGSHTYRVVGISSPANNSVLANNTTTGNSPAFLRVSKIVQATQWPAVTTGTIICTSSTRPSSPFEGQKIYETDTNLELTYDGSAWVQANSFGGWSTWTPQLYQNGNLTSTINHARYTRIGDTAIVQGKVTSTQAGTAGNQIEIRNLPYSAEAAGDYTQIGNAFYWDGTWRWQLNTETLPTATSIAFGYDSAAFSAYGGSRFGASPSKAVASGDFITFTVTYEVA